MFIPKSMEADDELIGVGSIYYHDNWRDSVNPFGQAFFSHSVFTDNIGLEEFHQSYEHHFELNTCIFKLFNTSFILMKTKDKIKQWFDLPEDVTKN